MKPLLKPLLHSNKPVFSDENTDRRSNTNYNIDKRSDPNLTYRLAQLSNWIFEKNEYRIPLGLIVDLVLVNFAIKTDTKIVITLERNLNKLFESNKKVTAIPNAPDALIQFHDKLYIS